MTEGQHDRLYRSPNRCHDKRFFYKYVSAAVAKTILVTRRLRSSSPLLFNDPFDVTQELRLNFDEAELSAVLAEELAVLIDEADFTAAPPHPALGVLLSILKSQSNPDVRRQIVEELRRESERPELQGSSSLRRTEANVEGDRYPHSGYCASRN